MLLQYFAVFFSVPHLSYKIIVEYCYSSYCLYHMILLYFRTLSYSSVERGHIVVLVGIVDRGFHFVHHTNVCNVDMFK